MSQSKTMEMEEIPEIDGDFPPRLSAKLAGHEAVEARFLQNLAQNRLHHAWLLTGAKGIGKAGFAFRLARFLLHHPNPVQAAQNANNLDIPEDSKTQQLVNRLSHPDLMVVNRPYDFDKGVFKADISVESIRNISHFLSLTGAVAHWRVCLIDSVDEMTVSGANALLKILEEPPINTLFLLISHNPGILTATIRSRCQIVPLSPLPLEIVQQILLEKKPELDPDSAAAMAFLANGSIGTALNLAEQGGLDVYREMLVILSAMPKPDNVKLHALAERMNSTDARGLFSLLMWFLTAWLHRMITTYARGQTSRAFFADEEETMCRFLATSSLEQWVEVWEKVGKLDREAERLNLDRKQAVLESFAFIRKAVA